LRPEQVAPAPDLVTADLSFISLGLVLPALIACAGGRRLRAPGQAAVRGGQDRVGNGVVRDPELRRRPSPPWPQR
jgi:23S rRNA (cytidine1920-2'-O)/16S rRNA (cytidine1409-2'-O)-methyltransferase